MLEAIFNDTVNTVTVTGLTQWDVGRKLYIKGLTLANNVQVHFADKINTEAIVTVGVNENGYTVAEIPNVMLETTHDIHAWVYEVNADMGKTIKSIYLKIEPRAKPQNFITENVPPKELENVYEKMNEISNFIDTLGLKATHDGSGNLTVCLEKGENL